MHFVLKHKPLCNHMLTALVITQPCKPVPFGFGLSGIGNLESVPRYFNERGWIRIRALGQCVKLRGVKNLKIVCITKHLVNFNKTIQSISFK